MADNIGNKAAHDYHLDIAPVQEGFYVKGAAHCDWGMKTVCPASLIPSRATR